jgi:hypothetical protein
MAYPTTLPAFVDLDYSARTEALVSLCAYVNAINQQQSGGSTHAIAVPNQSSAEGGSPAFGLIYINLAIAAMNATITRATLGTTPGTSYLDLDYSGFQPALNVALALATAVKTALGG